MNKNYVVSVDKHGRALSETIFSIMLCDSNSSSESLKIYIKSNVKDYLMIQKEHFFLSNVVELLLWDGSTLNANNLIALKSGDRLITDSSETNNFTIYRVVFFNYVLNKIKVKNNLKYSFETSEMRLMHIFNNYKILKNIIQLTKVITKGL